MDEGSRQRLVPILESCQLLGGVGRTTLYALVTAGQLTKVKIGSRSFITGESLRNFLDRLNESASGLSGDEGEVK